jgi:prevent-host-death family protein
MKTVGIYEAKTHLPRLIGEVEEGQTIIITRHGVAVAQLSPPPMARRRDAAVAVEALRVFQEREQITLGGISLRELIEEGRM